MGCLWKGQYETEDKIIYGTSPIRRYLATLPIPVSLVCALFIFLLFISFVPFTPFFTYFYGYVFKRLFFYFFLLSFFFFYFLFHLYLSITFSLFCFCRFPSNLSFNRFTYTSLSSYLARWHRLQPIGHQYYILKFNSLFYLISFKPPLPVLPITLNSLRQNTHCPILCCLLHTLSIYWPNNISQTLPWQPLQRPFFQWRMSRRWWPNDVFAGGRYLCKAD